MNELRKKLRPLDWITYVYLLYNVLLLAVGNEIIENSLLHILIFFGITMLVTIMISLHREDSGIVLTFLRNWYPFILFSYFFNFSTIANLVFFTDFIDPFFINIDQMMFGYQPAREWAARFNHILIQEFFYFAYFSYYALAPGLGFLLFFKKREQFQRYAFTIAFAFYVCYITYTILPVVGARYFPDLLELSTSIQGGPFRRLMAYIYTQSNHFGSAVPSSHVALTIIVNIALIDYYGKIGYYMIPWSLVIAISTVYCHYHYFIDAILGVVYGLVLYFPAVKLYSMINRLISERRTAEKKLWEMEKNAFVND